jgi:CRP-like cAMP-binding protein
MKPLVASPRPLQETPALAARAVELLLNPSGLLPFSADDARQLLPHLRLLVAPKGARLLNEGDDQDSGQMLLLLEGQVAVDTGAGVDNVAISVLGPGELLGELALLDGRPRSASCSALSEVRAALLSPQALQQLLQEQPAVAARLLAHIAQRIGERLRTLGEQLQMYAKVLEEQRTSR